MLSVFLQYIEGDYFFVRAFFGIFWRLINFMNVSLSIIACDSLYKRDVFRLPDPFVIVTVDGDQMKTTRVVKKSLNPYWQEHFTFIVNANQTFTMQVFDQRRFKKQDNQGLNLVYCRLSWCRKRPFVFIEPFGTKQRSNDDTRSKEIKFK